ncbi:peptide chain release factor N(5)-glutamine methyltransferase [Mycoplasmopsis ciconiae]|uniref:peptide chain release factor N(5)-glutamine methyltransferase n=1 Tax=Mycoplasmopsis ciconiae TaxID=561067 RepID=A0ABU7MLF8_9BACT|nr:peptide chain release factor N(5)-glutamine methyltransferase [Mycoplasmopsis ciconiae]
MPTIEDLLREKRRYNLKEEVTQAEEYLLQKNTPVQKIIGYVDMANVRIDVRNKVLIPRYETEELIMRLINEIPKNSRVLDLGCGSGFIAIALKYNRPDLEVVASDIDEVAIKTTKMNALLNGVKIEVIQSSYFYELSKFQGANAFDVIVSNPPYLQPSEVSDLSVLEHEPHLALFSDRLGWDTTYRILKNFRAYVKDNATLYFEINPNHIHLWEQLKDAFDIEITKDMEKRDRFVKIQMHPKF